MALVMMGTRFWFFHVTTEFCPFLFAPCALAPLDPKLNMVFGRGSEHISNGEKYISSMWFLSSPSPKVSPGTVFISSTEQSIEGGANGLFWWPILKNVGLFLKLRYWYLYRWVTFECITMKSPEDLEGPSEKCLFEHQKGHPFSTSRWFHSLQVR